MFFSRGFKEPEIDYLLEEANFEVTEDQMRHFISHRAFSHMKDFTQEEIDKMMTLVPDTGKPLPIKLCVSVMKIDAKD